MGGGGGGDTTTTNEPWEGQKPYLQDLFKQAQALFQNNVPQAYPGQMVAGFSPMTNMGISGLEQQGMAGSPLQYPTENFLGASLMNPAGMAGVGTDMPGQNPYLDTMVGNVGARMGEQFQDQIVPGINATFGGAGRTGSNLHGEVMGDASQQALETFGRQAADIYGEDYTGAMERDVDRRELMGDFGIKAATQAMMPQQMRQMQIDQLLKGGAITEDQAQRIIDAEIGRYNFNQQAPWDAAANYGNIIQGMPAGYGSVTAPGPNRNASRMQGAAGGAMAGSQIYPGWGTAIGAGLGYILS